MAPRLICDLAIKSKVTRREHLDTLEVLTDAEWTSLWRTVAHFRRTPRRARCAGAVDAGGERRPTSERTPGVGGKGGGAPSGAGGRA